MERTGAVSAARTGSGRGLGGCCGLGVGGGLGGSGFGGVGGSTTGGGGGTSGVCSGKASGTGGGGAGSGSGNNGSGVSGGGGSGGGDSSGGGGGSSGGGGVSSLGGSSTGGSTGGAASTEAMDISMPSGSISFSCSSLGRENPCKTKPSATVPTSATALLIHSFRCEITGGPHLFLPCHELDAGDASDFQGVHHTDDVLEGCALISGDDDGSALVASGRFHPLWQLRERDGYAIKKSLALAINSHGQANTLDNLVRRTRSWRGDLEAKGGEHVDADQYEEDEQKHHHIDHWNDLDASTSFHWRWPRAHVLDPYQKLISVNVR